MSAVLWQGRLPRSGSGAPPGTSTGVSKIAGLLLGTAAASVGIQTPLLPSGVPGLSWCLIAAAALVVALSSAARPPGRTWLGVLDLAFVLYLMIRVQVEVFNAADLGHGIGLARLIDLAMIYIAFVSVRNVTGSLEQTVGFLRWFALPVALVSLLAVAQMLQLPGVADFLIAITDSSSFERRTASGWDIRATSTIGHHTQLGGYLVGVTAIICSDLLISKRAGLGIVRPLVLLAFALLGQAATLTFATIAASLIIVIATMLIMGVRPSLVFVVGVTGGLAWIAFGAGIAERLENQQQTVGSEFSWLPETIAYRATIWASETIPAIAKRPWTGWGQDVYSAAGNGWTVLPHELVWSSPESEYFRVLVSGGVISLIFEVLLFAATIWVLARSNHIRGWNGFATPALVAFIVMLLASIIHSHFSSYGPPLVMWALVGALMAFSSTQSLHSLPDREPLISAARPRSRTQGQWQP